MGLRIKLAKGICLLILILSCERSLAFRVTTDFAAGAFWGSFPIQMGKFATSNIEDPLLSSLVDAAQRVWEDQVGREIWSIPSAYISNLGGNTVRWSYNFGAETGYDPSTTLAITIRYRFGNSFEKAEVILNGNNNALRTNQFDILYKTLLHEFGHVVGLDHSEYGTAIMAASLTGSNALHSDDIAGMNYVVDETMARQGGGGNLTTQSFETDSNQASLASCGSVDLGGGRGGPGNGSFILSLLLGILFTQLSKLSLIPITRQN